MADQSTTVVEQPTSRLRVGIARIDVTPPVGIYHRLWGAARHDRSTGVHRPVLADVLAFAPVGGDVPRMIRVQLDHAGLARGQHEDLVRAVSQATGVSASDVVVTYSHTHSAGWLVPDRMALPGGELIAPYLADLRQKLVEISRQAVAGMNDALITYAAGRCSLAANRDYWDSARGHHACGFNPDGPADDTVVVGRLTDPSGRHRATIVNYACHPTTLAWGNSLLSPDFVGAMREVVEKETDAPCVYFQGACGDLGPRQGFVGDPAIADRNGRQLGYAALSALLSLGPPGADYQYAGPVVSGATLGDWQYVAFDDDRQSATARFGGGSHTVALPLKELPDANALRAELVEWEARQREADVRGDVIAARDAGARAERARRWLGRLDDLPAGTSYPLGFAVYRLGDAVWVTVGGEPYNTLQVELRRRFPDLTVLVSPLAGDLQVAYLLPRDRYGRGLYQEEPSILAPGCLEMLIDAVAAEISALT